MKKFTLLAFFYSLLLLPQISHSQNKVVQRCATMDLLQKQLDSDPAFRARYQKGLAEYEESKNGINRNTRTSTLTSPVTIPVVVHIVLPNPYIVTDADVDYFIKRLNEDFAGENADSTNGVAFYPVRGHSLIRFTRAVRDVNGNFTTGIERRVGSGEFFGNTTEPIKSAATGGLSPWDHTKYYNLWVGDGGGILGVAPSIGPGTAANDGVCVDQSAFSNNPCYSDPFFNLARTAVHEIGHNFGLYHIFDGGCSATWDPLESTCRHASLSIL